MGSFTSNGIKNQGLTLFRINDRRVRSVGAAEGSADEWLTQYSYDAAGRLQNLTDHKVSTTTPFTYTWNDHASLVASISMPSGARQNKAYDALGRLELIEAYNQANTKINSFDYTYNSVNQREQVTLVDGHKIDYTYDQQRQLDTAKKKTSSNVQVAGYDFDYNFDEIGNRTTATQLNGEMFTYTANSLNQYTLIDPTAGTAANPTYDDNGSLLSDGRISNTWNEENRLKIIIDSSKNTRSEYLYDGNGRRIQRDDYNTVSGGTPIKTNRYLYEGWNCVADYSIQGSTATLETAYTWGLDLSNTAQGAGGVGGLLAMTTAAGVSHEVIYDGNGNVSDLLDVSGAVTAHYEYDPFGNTIAQSGYFADENTYRFSTKPMNTHAGELSYYGYRYYDPVTGRWPSRDPIEELRMGYDSQRRQAEIALKIRGQYLWGKMRKNGISLSEVEELDRVAEELERYRRENTESLSLSVKCRYCFNENDGINKYDLLGLRPRAIYRPVSGYGWMGWAAPAWHALVEYDDGSTDSSTGQEGEEHETITPRPEYPAEKKPGNNKSWKEIEDCLRKAFAKANSTPSKGLWDDLTKNNCGNVLKDAFDDCGLKDPTPWWLSY